MEPPGLGVTAAAVSPERRGNHGKARIRDDKQDALTGQAQPRDHRRLYHGR
ncbi:hypothetical protein [Aeromonas simiae]|nr:hypothetical protein [Aeromonas simiae]MDO2947067.1 hypothetical protein [Aeromonas simiae]MDO2950679.1 hypothetical protein [Aeromonas simiae]MDO2954339.1 hypothetical protein [Aeromonas simiae]